MGCCTSTPEEKEVPETDPPPDDVTTTLTFEIDTQKIEIFKFKKHKL